MKTRLLTTLGLCALVAGLICVRGVPSASATPGYGATKFDTKVSNYPNQCTTVQQTRVGLTSTAAANVPAVPLANRNAVIVCLSPESYTLVDAGYVGSYAKLRWDNGIPALGTPLAIDGGSAPGLVLAFTGLPNSIGQICTPEIHTQSLPDAGGWIQGLASYNLLDAGPQVFVDVVECAY